MAIPDTGLASLTFPIQYLETAESLANEMRQDPKKFYLSCGVDASRPFIPSQTINGKQIQLALEYVLRICPAGPPPLVTFMAHLPLTSHGPVGMLAITSANLAEALESALRYASLVMPAFHMRREDLGDEVHLIVERQHDFGDVNDFFTETVVTAPLGIRPFLKHPISGVTVHLMHRPLGRLAEYEAFFGTTFIFNATQNKVVLPLQALNTPLIVPSRASHLLMRTTLDQQFLSNTATKPVTEDVKRQLHRAMLQRRELDLEALAELMATSPRTLSRRLKEEGNTFAQIRMEVKVKYAEVLLLETTKTMAQIAEATGFGDAATFTKSFKRVMGQTPSHKRLGGRHLTAIKA